MPFYVNVSLGLLLASLVMAGCTDKGDDQGTSSGTTTVSDDGGGDDGGDNDGGDNDGGGDNGGGDGDSDDPPPEYWSGSYTEFSVDLWHSGGRDSSGQVCGQSTYDTTGSFRISSSGQLTGTFTCDNRDLRYDYGFDDDLEFTLTADSDCEYGSAGTWSCTLDGEVSVDGMSGRTGSMSSGTGNVTGTLYLTTEEAYGHDDYRFMNHWRLDISRLATQWTYEDGDRETWEFDAEVVNNLVPN